MDLLGKVVVNLYSDTFTLIVGFVAIGIPLALQIAVNTSEKYDNSLVIKRLTTGWIINPITLILFSTIYVSLSLLLKVSHPNNSEKILFFSNYLAELRSILGFVFICIIIGAGYFYIRFYFRVLQPTEKYVDDFLFFNNPLKLSIYWLNNRFEWNALSKYVDDLEAKKIEQKHFKSINAGLEVLIAQLEKKSWEKGYIDILLKLNTKIRSAYLKQNKKNAPKLSPTDVLLLKMYWDALIRIIKLSRGNQDSKLSFHSQRLLSSLAVNFIHHPQYNDIMTTNFLPDKEEKINWSHDLYEIARWQSQQDSKGIDLVLECEWIRDLCGILVDLDYRYSKLGTVNAFKTFTNILELVADKHPDKIFDVYKNFSEGMPSYHGYSHIPSVWNKKTAWIYNFWSSFDSKTFSLVGNDKITDELLTLKNGAAYIKYGNYGTSRPLSKQEIDFELSRVNYKEIYKKSYLEYCDLLALKFVATLVYFKRWDELKHCLEWAQPRDSQVNYIGNVLLANNDKEAEQLIFKKFDALENSHWFIERHDILPFASRGLLFQLVFYCEKTGNFGDLFSSGGLEDSRKQSRILKSLIDQEKFIEDSQAFDSKEITAVVNNLKNSLENLETRSRGLLETSDPSPARWEEFKVAVENGWNAELKSDSLAQKVITTLNYRFTDRICPIEIKLMAHEFKKENFIEGFPSIANNELFGETAFKNVLSPVYEAIKNKAVKCVNIDIDKAQNALIFATSTKLRDLGLLRSENGHGLWSHPDKNWKGVCVEDPSLAHGVFIDTNNIQLLFTRHLICANNPHPLFSYYVNKKKGKILVKLSAYIEVVPLRDSAILLI